MNMKLTPEASTWTAGATVLAPISWGTTYVTITELLPDGRPLLVATMRVVPSGLALLIAGTLASRWRPRGPEWWRTGMLAVVNFGVFFPLLVVAVYRLPGGVAAAVGGLQPLFVAALTWLIAGRRPRALDLAVGCVAALGVGLVVIRPGADLDPVGLLAAVGANVSFAVGVVLTKRFHAPSNRLAATGWQLLLSGLILVPLAAVAEGAPPSLTMSNVAGFAYLSGVGTALAFVLWFNGIRRLPAAAPPLLGLAAPITGAVLGWAILGQSLSPLQLTGFVVTLAAIAYGASLPRRRRHRPPDHMKPQSAFSSSQASTRWRPRSAWVCPVSPVTAKVSRGSARPAPLEPGTTAQSSPPTPPEQRPLVARLVPSPVVRTPATLLACPGARTGVPDGRPPDRREPVWC
jgi:probable blue pigment (indigoidine) exporter